MDTPPVTTATTSAVGGGSYGPRRSTPPTVLADPIDEHRLPESNDPPTATERDDLRRALLDSWADDPNVLAAYRAGWDRGVNDHAEASRTAGGAS